MTKLSEIIEFPKEKITPRNKSDEDWCYDQGYNQALDECDVDVELSVDAITKLLIKTKENYDALTRFEKVSMPVGCDGPRLYAQAIADNLLNLLRRKK